MIIRTLRYLLVYLLTLSLIYSPIIRADSLALPSTDLVAPQVLHETITEPAAPGESHKFSATVTDNVAVQSVTLFYRTKGTQSYKRKPMVSQGKDVYTAIISGDEMQPPGIEYYIQATDTSGNNLLHGYSFSPLVVAVTGAAAVAPAKKPLAAKSKEEKSSNKWLWIGLGVLAAAALAGGGGGGGGTDTATLSITTSEPTP